MKRTLPVVITVALLGGLLSHPNSASAQEGKPSQHMHTHESSEKLGQVNFTVSCNPQAQR